MTLEPTPRLRFVNKIVVFQSFQSLGQNKVTRARVLQQWWRDVQTGEGEWRDVPLEAE